MSIIHPSARIHTGLARARDIALTMEENTFIGTYAMILVPKLTMRKGSQINAGTVLAGKDEIILEENVVVGYNCVLLTASDTSEGRFMNDASPEEDRIIKRGPIILKKNCFIGSQTLIMPNVTIGEGTVIGAQSYIDKDIEDNVIYIPSRYYISLRRDRK